MTSPYDGAPTRGYGGPQPDPRQPLHATYPDPEVAPSGHADQEPHTGRSHGGHGGHGLMMLACCIPMTAIAVILVATGVAGSGALIAALLCVVMMAAMMFAMRRGGGSGWLAAAVVGTVVLFRPVWIYQVSSVVALVPGMFGSRFWSHSPDLSDLSLSLTPGAVTLTGAGPPMPPGRARVNASRYPVALAPGELSRGPPAALPGEPRRARYCPAAPH